MADQYIHDRFRGFSHTVFERINHCQRMDNLVFQDILQNSRCRTLTCLANNLVGKGGQFVTLILEQQKCFKRIAMRCISDLRWGRKRCASGNQEFGNLCVTATDG